MELHKYFSVICNFFFIFLSICKTTESANILILSTVVSPSHDIWQKTLAIALRDRGHNITYVTHYPNKSMNNFTTIILEGVEEQLTEDYSLEDTASFNEMASIDILFEWTILSCDLDLKTDGYQKLVKMTKSDVKFDLIIFDMTCGLCFYPIVEFLGFPPLIATVPFGIPPFVAENFGIDLHTSYVPHYSVRYTTDMNFIQRFWNYFYQMYELSLKYYYWGKIKTMLDNFYGRDMSHIYDIERNFSLMLPNYDPVFDYPRPLPPDVIPVGGLHTKRAKSLPQDLQEYLDKSEDGVIIFSLGTNLRSDKLNEESRKGILDAFSRVKQNVIWKFESDITGLPKNVIVRKFLPQNDILAHPKVKLLINHGGGLSTQEAMYHGVPLICIPFFLDQSTITHRVVTRKIGLFLHFKNLTSDSILSSINEVLNNPLYTKNIKKISRRYHDRPDGPLDRAVFWIEHVLRQGGTQHLRTPARFMPFCYTSNLDIWTFIISIVIISVFITKKIYYKCFGVQKQTTQESKLKTK